MINVVTHFIYQLTNNKIFMERFTNDRDKFLNEIKIELYKFEEEPQMKAEFVFLEMP